MLKDDSQTNKDENTVRKDTTTVTSEVQDLVIEAKSNLCILIGGILIISLISILLSTWLAKLLSNSSSSFTTILSRYFGFDHNETEATLTWWKPMHIQSSTIHPRTSAINRTNSTAKPNPNAYNDYPMFYVVVLPLMSFGAILLAVAAFYLRIKCTNRGFVWNAVPKMPFGRVDSQIAKATMASIVKIQQAEPSVDYKIVQGTEDRPVVFALAETLVPLMEEHEPGTVINEGTQYEPEDIPKTITHVSSAPDLHNTKPNTPSI